ncbi:MAG: Methylmuconolactone methyl-isomerase [Acidimicrobiaceae bacterium]|nr:Methylmuconolactone methyl-isomerase [Acidimicrobiaceae bacterium]
MNEPTVYCVILYRKDGVSREQFLEAWLGEHRRLIGDLSGLTDVRLLPVAEPADGGPDGVGLLRFASAAQLTAALQSEPALTLRRHTATFSKSDAAVRLLLTEP